MIYHLINSRYDSQIEGAGSLQAGGAFDEDDTQDLVSFFIVGRRRALRDVLCRFLLFSRLTVHQ